MEQFFTFPFFVLEVPNMKIKRPAWLQQPSAMTMFAVVLLSYFLVTGGELYKVYRSQTKRYITLYARYHI